MGRRKIELKLIHNQKRRYVTYQKRKKGLEKKAYELSTLCDVKVCLIIYGPKGNTENQTQELNIWPENPDFVRSMIESYLEQSESNKKVRTQDLSNFYNNLAKKAEYERGKLDKRKHDVKYPTWDERFNSLSGCQLRQVISELEVKVAGVKARIDLLKGRKMFSQAPRMRRFLGAQGTEESNPPPPRVAQRLVGTSNLQMGNIQQTSYNNVNPMMNPVKLEPCHHDRLLVAAEVRVSNRVMVGPMPSLLHCSQPTAVIRPYGQNLPAATVPYGWNLPAAMIPSGPSLEMHYSDYVMRMRNGPSGYHL